MPIIDIKHIIFRKTLVHSFDLYAEIYDGVVRKVSKGLKERKNYIKSSNSLLTLYSISL